VDKKTGTAARLNRDDSCNKFAWQNYSHAIIIPPLKKQYNSFFVLNKIHKAASPEFIKR
jgi:hypothetical protein